MSAMIQLWQPNGGEKWAIGQPEKITWIHEDFAGKIKLELYQKDKLIGPIITGISVDDNVWDWQKVGNLENGLKAKAANDYKIRVSAIDGSLSDESDGLFMILVQTGNFKKPTITSPNGGEIWTFEDPKKITWVSRQISSDIKLELLQNHKLIGTIAERISVATGSYEWNVGQYKDNLKNDLIAPTGKGYSIRISTLDGSFTDDSDAPFRIEHCLNLVYPNGGETFSHSPPLIRWVYYGIDGNTPVKLELLKDDKLVGIIAENIKVLRQARGWNGRLEKPDSIAKDGCGYKVRICTMDGKYQAESSRTFCIELAKVSLGKIDPYLIAGSNITITWEYKNIHDAFYMDFELVSSSKTLGSLTKKRILVTDGSFQWVVGQYYDRSQSPLLSKTADDGDYNIKLKVLEIVIWDSITIYHENINILKECHQLITAHSGKEYIPIAPGFLPATGLSLDTRGTGTATGDKGPGVLIGASSHTKSDWIVGIKITDWALSAFAAHLRFDLERIPEWAKLESATISLMVVDSVVNDFNIQKNLRIDDPNLIWYFVLCNKRPDERTMDCDGELPIPGYNLISWSGNSAIIDITQTVMDWFHKKRNNFGLVLDSPATRFIFNFPDKFDNSFVMLKIVVSVSAKIRPSRYVAPPPGPQ